jgi:hypothetical protein
VGWRRSGFLQTITPSHVSGLPPSGTLLLPIQCRRLNHVTAGRCALLPHVYEGAAEGTDSQISLAILQERQQVSIDRLRMRGRHTVREVLVGFQRSVLQ